MDNTVWSNVSWIELFWLVLMSGGLLISLYNVWDGIKDKRAMQRQKVNGVAKILIDATIKADVSRSIQFMLLLALGVFAAYSAPMIVTEVHGFAWWYRLTGLVAILGTGMLHSYNALNARLSARKALQLTTLRRHTDDKSKRR